MNTLRSIITHLVITAFPLGAISAATMPIAVEIVPKASQMRDSGIPIGNVRVRFKDGHTELWTKRGHCLIAKITRNGLVGWAHYNELNGRAAPGNALIRLMVSTDHWVDFLSGYPYIDNWDTSQDGATLVMRSGFSHGPARFELFDIATHKLIEQTIEEPYAKLPAWARPLAIDQPKP